MKEKYVTTDLACERIKSQNECQKQDAEYTEDICHGFDIHTLKVKTKDGENATCIPIGEYVTLYYENILHADEEKKHRLSLAISTVIRKMFPETCTSILVAGIGNPTLSSDSIGPLCAQKTTATRHVKIHDEALFASLGTKEISVLSPGVMSQTGIESAEIFKGIASVISPCVVIAVDSLRARSISRLGCTVQISNVGIKPGSGIGNTRASIDESSIGCKIISIGVPTVVSTSTLVYDAFERCNQNITEDMKKILEEGESFFVVQNDIGELNECISEIISEAIILACES